MAHTLCFTSNVVEQIMRTKRVFRDRSNLMEIYNSEDTVCSFCLSGETLLSQTDELAVVSPGTLPIKSKQMLSVFIMIYMTYSTCICSIWPNTDSLPFAKVANCNCQLLLAGSRTRLSNLLVNMTDPWDQRNLWGHYQGCLRSIQMEIQLYLLLK